MVFGLTVILYYSFKHKVTFFNAVSFLSGLVVLILTASLNAYLALLLGISFLLLAKYGGRSVSKVFFYLLILLNLVFLLSPRLFKTSSQHSFYRRNDLTLVSFEMIKDKPFSGVGLNSFTKSLQDYKFIQPVHNIFLLLASEAGLLTLVAFLFFLFLLITKSIAKGSDFFPTVLLFELLFLGTFDHYLLTIQQGLLLLWLTLGMVLSTITSHEKSLAQSKN